MDLVGSAFNTERSDLQKRRVCVRAGEYRFPKDCLLCGSNEEVTQTPVEFKAVLLLGFIAGGETTTLAFPLCELCSQTYLQALKRANLRMNASFLLGFGGLAFLGILNEVAPKTLKSIPSGVVDACVGFGLLLILVSFVMLLTKNRNFPIKLKHRGWIFQDDKHHVFTFPNDEIMNRFIKANSELEGSVEASPAISTQSFGKGI